MVGGYTTEDDEVFAERRVVDGRAPSAHLQPAAAHHATSAVVTPNCRGGAYSRYYESSWIGFDTQQWEVRW